MNPARPAISRLDQIDRARMIAKTLPVRALVGYLRRMGRPDQLIALQAVQKAVGTPKAAQAMLGLGWSIEAACLTLLGPDGLERHLNRMILQ